MLDESMLCMYCISVNTSFYLFKLRPSLDATPFRVRMTDSGIGWILKLSLETIFIVVSILTYVVRLPVGSMAMHSSTRDSIELFVVHLVQSA